MDKDTTYFNANYNQRRRVWYFQNLVLFLGGGHKQPDFQSFFPGRKSIPSRGKGAAHARAADAAFLQTKLMGNSRNTYKMVIIDFSSQEVENKQACCVFSSSTEIQIGSRTSNIEAKLVVLQQFQFSHFTVTHRNKFLCIQ